MSGVQLQGLQNASQVVEAAMDVSEKALHVFPGNVLQVPEWECFQEVGTNPTAIPLAASCPEEDIVIDTVLVHELQYSLEQAMKNQPTSYFVTIKLESMSVLESLNAM